ATLSPDGRHIAFLAPRGGVMNIWVAPTHDLEAARPLSAETQRPVLMFFWTHDSARLLYPQDSGGTENYLLYGVDLEGRGQAYTPFEKTRVQVVRTSHAVPDAILIGLNNRDPAWHDVWRLEHATGKLTELWRNEGGYAGVTADHDFSLILAQKNLPDGGSEIFRFEAGGALTSLFKYGLEDSQTTAVLRARDARHVYMLDSRGRDKAALTLFDAVTRESRLVAEDAKADVRGVMHDPETGGVVAYQAEYLTRQWVGLTPDAQAAIDFLDAHAGGQWSRISHSHDDRLWTIGVERAGSPVVNCLYDRDAGALTDLFSTRPELDGKPLSRMHPLEIRTRDGLTMVSYLSLPAGSDSDGDGAPDQPLPLVLFVHGGPWARDVFGYHPYHQWLANRGYAVLSVNYRGSTGFGKAYISAGDLEWGRKMHDDLIDAVEHAIRTGVTTRDMVAIMGGSYGGYATLAGVTLTPKVFRCGVDIVGPSNLFTLLETIPPYWAAIYEQFARRMGDPRTEAGRALLKERSPLTYVDKIEVPLLIGQGANDPRVNQRESDQIVAAMKAKGIPVTYVLYPDEGHGFARPENNLAFSAIAEGFLAECLGGAAQPIGDDLKGSSAQVPEGADIVGGLTEALAARG
ncbi:MAG TPA: S9 family peptidase, partial [Caulobacteraceae bacterium]|nr:S9 family peptidase [Caulobacteraceae bacterium]